MKLIRMCDTKELHRLVLMDYNNRLNNFREERDTLEKKFIEETQKLFNEILAEEIKKNEIKVLSRELKEFTSKKFSNNAKRRPLDCKGFKYGDTK